MKQKENCGMILQRQRPHWGINQKVDHRYYRESSICFDVFCEVGTDDRFGNMDNENNESRKKVVQKLSAKQKRNPDH
jgi:hypothetical protein